MWDSIVGQDHAVATLRAAAARPSHAYILVGSEGSGMLEAARAFACEIIGETDDRSRALVARGASRRGGVRADHGDLHAANEIRSPRGARPLAAIRRCRG